MKRILSTMVILVAIILMAGSSFAAPLFSGQRTSMLSTGLTSSGQGVTGACAFYGYIVNTDGSHAVTLSFYDNTSAVAGSVVLPASITIPATPQTQYLFYPLPLNPQTGVYVSISVPGGTATVWVNYNQ